jgi:hypothetical protein
MSSQISKITADYLAKIMQFVNEHGELDACLEFKINIETLHRYQRLVRFNETMQPKVLLLDTETSPLTVYTFEIRKTFIPHTNIIDDTFLLCWSAKWLFDSQMMSDVLTPEEARDKNDNRIVNSIWKLLEQADVIIAHNAKKFDLPYLDYRFVMNGLKPPSPYQTIDTLEKSKKHFRFSSNRLDYLGMLIRNKGKIKTDIDLWKGCLEGNQESLDNMLKYNKEDVCLLEDVYMFIRPFIHSHPNMAIYQESKEPSCPTCGSVDITDCGHYTTMVNRYKAFRCNACGSICRERLPDTPLEMKKAILRSTAR